jgi:molybdopterin-guanine dinucleotide biosynthesis protein A
VAPDFWLRAASARWRQRGAHANFFGVANAIIFGALLAGGEGRRIGGAKALIDLGGAPLLAHAARSLRPAAAALAVVGDAEAARLLDAEALSDPPGAARGPLAGVCAALDWAERRGAGWLALAPCDTPFLPDDLVALLLDAALQAHAPIACAKTADGVHPLVSLWRVDVAGAVRAALRERRHPAIHRFIADLGAAHLALADADLANINTPEDLEAARARFARRG